MTPARDLKQFTSKLQSDMRRTSPLCSGIVVSGKSRIKMLTLLNVFDAKGRFDCKSSHKMLAGCQSRIKIITLLNAFDAKARFDCKLPYQMLAGSATGSGHTSRAL